ncbi:MAG TPA: hypothetical protein VED20_16855 [Streptosporangiaceae bacterium]|nr:hypothetical protein [Streptosporangiaceae bacterium]
MRVFAAEATGVIGQYLVPGLMLEVVPKRQMPVIDGGTGIWSLPGVTDAASWRSGFPAWAEEYEARQAAHDHAA